MHFLPQGEADVRAQYDSCPRGKCSGAVEALSLKGHINWWVKKQDQHVSCSMMAYDRPQNGVVSEDIA